MGKYHMNKSEKEITNPEELARIITGGKYAVIAMCRSNEPYIVTLSYGYDRDGNVLYFHSAKKGLKLDFISSNPNVCATVIEDRGYKVNECEHSYASVVMWGKMSIVESLEEKKHALDVMITHLEEKSDAVKARILKNDKVYEGVGILKLEIGEMTGKSGS